MESADTNLSQRLVGQRLPAVRLLSTTGKIVDLTLISAGRTVIYCYPRTSEPMQLIRRLTIIARGRAIEAALYPVLQPAESANDVIGWLKAHPL
jgi:hypothetical protein